MNEWYRLNSELIRSYLDSEDRKQSYLSRRLGCSGALVDRMLGRGHVPKERTLTALADLLGVSIEDLLVPKDGKRSA